MEIHYHRPQETDAQGQSYPEEKEVTIIWIPAIWETIPEYADVRRQSFSSLFDLG